MCPSPQRPPAEPLTVSHPGRPRSGRPHRAAAVFLRPSMAGAGRRPPCPPWPLAARKGGVGPGLPSGGPRCARPGIHARGIHAAPGFARPASMPAPAGFPGANSFAPNQSFPTSGSALASLGLSPRTPRSAAAIHGNVRRASCPPCFPPVSVSFTSSVDPPWFPVTDFDPPPSRIDKRDFAHIRTLARILRCCTLPHKTQDTLVHGHQNGWRPSGNPLEALRESPSTFSMPGPIMATMSGSRRFWTIVWAMSPAAAQ